MSSLSLIESSLKKNQKTTFISQGDSMFPLIPNNTKITITPKKFSEIKIYDIVAIKSQKNIIIHQCLFKSSKYLVCQGVNNHFIDPPAFSNQILGVIEIGNYYQKVNLIYDYELQQIRRLAPKIPILVLKGATWQKEFYGYYLNKASSDIDILINKSDYPQFKKVLLHQGYHFHKNISVSSKHYHSLEISELSFSKKINSQNISIDVHFNAIRSPLNSIFKAPIDPIKMNQLTSEFWQSSISKNNLHFLKNEYLLFYFCLNSIFHHAVRGTDLLATIANIISNKKINWIKFWHLTDKYQLSTFIYYPLGWSSRLFKVKIPNIKHYRSNIFRRFLIKIFINHYTVFHPLQNLGKNYLSSKINVILIFIIRLCLYEK